MASAVPARAELTAAKTGSLPQAPQSARAAQTSTASPTVPQADAQPAVGMSTELLNKIASADWQALQTLSQHCTACALSAMGRQHVVFSDGGPGPKLVVVGEAPGAEEDLQGIPFVGKSGKLLTAMLDSLGLVRRRDCVILNVLKCRPPRNRNPQPEEIVCCGHLPSLLFASIAGSQVQGLGRSAAAQGGDEAGRADAACSGKALGLSLLRLRFQVLFCSPLRLQRPICCFLIQTVECG